MTQNKPKNSSPEQRGLSRESRPNATARSGEAIRWTRKATAGEIGRARDTRFGLGALSENVTHSNSKDLFEPLGVPPHGIEARTEYRRHATIRAIGASKSLTADERMLLGMRFGLDGEIQSLEDVAEKMETTREEVRRYESLAMKKVLQETPGLKEIYSWRWITEEQ